jgi:hypothetical protein
VVAGIQYHIPNNAQIVFEIVHATVQTTPQARLVGTLRAQGFLGQTEFQHYRPASRQADDGGTTNGPDLDHVFGHGGIDRVGAHRENLVLMIDNL